jgi:hypothetical protein
LYTQPIQLHLRFQKDMECSIINRIKTLLLQSAFRKTNRDWSQEGQKPETSFLRKNLLCSAENLILISDWYSVILMLLTQRRIKGAFDLLTNMTV